MPEAVTTRTSAEIEAELASLPVRNESDSGEGGSSATSTSNQTVTAVTVDADVTTATRKGWVPKAEYTGDPAKWVDAKTFVERGERFNHNLQRELAIVKGKLEAFEGTKQAFIKFHEETVKKKDEELASAITRLRVERSEAIGDGEHETAVALEDRIELLQQERKDIKAIPTEQATADAAKDRKPGPNPEDPVLLEWIDDGNQWFNTDPQLRAYAVAVGEDLITKGETVRGRKFLDKVASLMAEEFPRKFAKLTAAVTEGLPNPMDGGTGNSKPGGAGVNGGKTEKDLPDVDLQLMKQFIREGWTTKEKFLAGYFSR